MSIKKSLSFAEIENALNDHDFLSDLKESEFPIDIVQLPPDTVDCVTYEEDIDENNLDDNCPKDVPGSVEIQAAATNKGNFTITLDQQTRTKPTPAKRRKVDSSN